MSDLIGYEKVMSQLEKLSKLKYLEAALEALTIAFEKSQELVPVDTGELKESGSVKQTDEGAIIEYTSDHAIFPEFGTLHQAAQPYLRPAVDESIDEMIAVAKKKIEELIEETL